MSHITKIENLLNNCIDCAGINQGKALRTAPKPCSDGYYVDVCIEEYDDESLAYLVGFLAQSIGMKNIWLDTYPSSGRVHIELNFTQEFLAR
jgi:hypothetical protein